MKQLSSPLQQYWPTVVERLPAAISESSLSIQAKSVLTFSDFFATALLPIPNGWSNWKARHPRRMNGNTMLIGYSKHWSTLATKTR